MIEFLIYMLIWAGGWIGSAKLVQHIHKKAYKIHKSPDNMIPEKIVKGWFKPYLVDSTSYLWPITWMMLLLLIIVYKVIEWIGKIWKKIK